MSVITEDILFKARMELMASATELLNIDEVSDIQMRVHDLEQTQIQYIQLLDDELKENRARLSFIRNNKPSYFLVDNIIPSLYTHQARSYPFLI